MSETRNKHPNHGYHSKHSLRSAPSEGPVDPRSKRFDIFLIDTGWNTTLSKMVRSHMTMIAEFEKHDAIYILTAQQSIELMKSAPRLIGHDPIILVYDRLAPASRKDRGYRGFRLNLGLIKSPEQALARMLEFLRFMALNRTAVPLDRQIRRELYREGLEGMIKILKEASTELL